MKTRIMITLAVAFVLLNIVDMVLTLRALEAGASELNPIMKAFIDMGFYNVIAVKVGIPAVIGLMMVLRRKLTSLAIVTTVLTGVCIWNTGVLI